MRVVIDHLAGARRGQRQELPADVRVRFGRHPDCEVSFDAYRDIDASSRHAELRRVEYPASPSGDADGRGQAPPVVTGWVLFDLGSSNGTYVDGHRVTEAPVAVGAPVNIQFGPGGPRLRLFVGEDAAVAALPPAPVESVRPRWLYPALASLAVIVLAVVAARC